MLSCVQIASETRDSNMDCDSIIFQNIVVSGCSVRTLQSYVVTPHRTFRYPSCVPHTDFPLVSEVILELAIQYSPHAPFVLLPTIIAVTRLQLHRFGFVFLEKKYFH